MSYLKSKKGSLESSILGIWKEAASKVKEGSKEEYQKFFNSALKKFKIDSPADLKSDEEKKKFFNYVDKNYKGEKDEQVTRHIESLRPSKMVNEREKGIDSLPRQFLNPDKEVMIIKKGKVIVIDKKDQDRYTKQGWELAEITKENYEVGTKERRDHTLKTTPGQSPKEFEQQVEVMHKKKNSMREALAKMWGIEEGKNPFDKKEEKKYNKGKSEGKTLTGKPETKVEVEPKMEKKNK